MKGFYHKCPWCNMGFKNRRLWDTHVCKPMLKEIIREVLDEHGMHNVSVEDFLRSGQSLIKHGSN